MQVVFQCVPVEALERELRNRRQAAASDRKRANLERSSGTLKVPTGNNERVWLLEQANRQDRIADEIETRLEDVSGRLF